MAHVEDSGSLETSAGNHSGSLLPRSASPSIPSNSPAVPRHPSPEDSESQTRAPSTTLVAAAAATASEHPAVLEQNGDAPPSSSSPHMSDQHHGQAPQPQHPQQLRSQQQQQPDAAAGGRPQSVVPYPPQSPYTQANAAAQPYAYSGTPLPSSQAPAEAYKSNTGVTSPPMAPLPSMRSLNLEGQQQQQQQQQQQVPVNVPLPVHNPGLPPYYQPQHMSMPPGHYLPPYPQASALPPYPQPPDPRIYQPASDPRIYQQPASDPRMYHPPGDARMFPQLGDPRIYPRPGKKEIKRRTKTGCMTCRKRRIKCDEAHPHCNNCKKSKRECLGYDPVFKTAAVPSAIQPAPNSTQPAGVPTLPSSASTVSTTDSFSGPAPSAPAPYGSSTPPAFHSGFAGSADAPQTAEKYDYSNAIDPSLQESGGIAQRVMKQESPDFTDRAGFQR